MLGATAGLRVLDLTEGLAGPLATMVLADFGAEVIRVDNISERDCAEEEPAYLLLNRGKKSVGIDLGSPEGGDQIRKLVPAVDVVVVALPPEKLRHSAIDYDAFASLNPALVYCDITAFGRTGPLAGLDADDGLVMAKAGIFRDQAGWHAEGHRPVFRASRDGSYFAAMLAVQGILAALRARELTGEGQLVTTTMLQALSCRQNPGVRWLLRDGEELPAEAAVEASPKQDEAHTLPHHRDPREANLIGMRVECQDGRWIVHSHTEPHFFPAWIEVLGFDWIWNDERFKGAPYRFPDNEARSELISLIQQRMKECTAAQWLDAYVANGNVCGDVVQTTQEALRHPQLAAYGATVEVTDPRVGPILEVGPLAKIPTAPAHVRGPAPTPGEHSDEIPKLRTESPFPARPSAPAELSDGPLAGITIIEAAYYYATPFATALLTDLGARVIKIEPVRGDPYRALAGGAGVSDPVLNLGHNNMVRAMQGKESIALNLKDPRGREIVHRLVANADVFVHSFRPGVPESLGIDEETLRAIKPDIVYQYGASYGSTGPYSRQPAIDPVIAAFAGTTDYQAGQGNPPLTETGADPVAAAGHAAAMMLGILARQRTAQGQHVESAMIVSNIYLNCEDALAYDGKQPRRSPDHLQLGTGATYRLYETAPLRDAETIEPYDNPDSRWVFLAALSDEQFAAFCSVAGRDDLASDPRFASRAARDVHDAALAELLEAVFRTRPAREWESASVAAGVGCVVADAMSHFAFLYRDPQSLAVGMMAASQHPSFGGTYGRHAPVVGFSRTPGHGGAFCEKGEHTRAILEELGYDARTITLLKEEAVISWPSDQTAAAMALS
ncbi:MULTISPECIES: CoA transferase [Mycobacteriaceae]|uniref:CaiB/BaiF CoA-transferase family protein n=1 Tax=Mycobacteriaceae TaxID=1762 RepID=UPI000D3B9397|nr:MULTISPECIES: CoA transferase [Mycobacteriaceae]TDO06389.1 crotonobetainyl-CoA:carnitine CoA-transferase CaiB-like acyl-CoA transferase [Mycobacterium sp. BK086]